MAAEVKRLPRAPVSLWVMNRLAHEQPALIESYLEAAQALREAHRSGGNIRAATRPQRDAESRVVAAAAELARTHGQNVTETVIRGLHETLGAAAADGDVATAMRAGRLIREPVAPSIEELLWSLPQEALSNSGKATTKAQAPDRRAERRALQKRIADAKAEASRSRRDARKASTAVEAASRALLSAEEIAAKTHQTAEAAEQVLEDLQRELDAF